MNENISFQSKINFVKPQDLFAGKDFIRSKLVEFSLNAPLYEKGDIFHTNHIKTCTGGGFTDGKTKALGFHWLDDFENYSRINRMCNSVFNVFKNKNINGLIVGGKDIKGRDYSINTLRYVIDYFTERVKHLSVFEEHLDRNASTSYMYDLKKDTWTLSSGYIDKDGVYHYVKDLEDLKKFYKRIIIAENDVLCIDGKEQFIQN